jgi:class 3 adenylate cyclase
MSARAAAAAEEQVEAERVPDLRLKGFAKPVMAFSVRKLKPAGRTLVPPDDASGQAKEPAESAGS